MDNIDLIEDIDDTDLTQSFSTDAPEYCLSHLESTHFQLTVICQNIRSVQKNFDHFLVFLSRLQFLPDVIILTECWINEDSPGLTLPNYTYHSSTQFINQNDGIIIFTKTELNVTIEEPAFQDANCLVVHIGNELSIVSIYRTPSVQNIDRFSNSLEIALQSLKNESRLILGDININISNDSSDRRALDYLDLTGHYGYIPGHTLPTRGPSCLDHAMVNSNKKTKVIICNTDITDHCTVIVGVERQPASNAEKADSARTYTKINYDAITQDLANLDWTEFFRLEDVTEAVSYITDILRGLIAKHTTTKYRKNEEVIIRPWITPNLLKCIRKKDNLHLTAKKNQNDVSIQNNYKKYRNYCMTTIHNVKKTYKQNQLKEAKGNSKKTWHCIKSICNLKPPKNTNDKITRDSSNSNESINNVSNYFASVGRTLANTILESLDKTEEQLAALVSPPLSGTPADSFFLTPTDHIEISKIINSLKTNSAPGWDNITNNLLKQNHDVLSPIIAFIANLSISSGVMPDSLKLANVTPIFKSGDPQVASNYRPISLLTSISKIIEKVINKRLLSYLERHGLLSDNQFGFRNNTSTEDAVTNLTDFVKNKLDQGQRCVGVFLDLAKAFDTVSRLILLKKMETMGIRGTPLSWFQSYLSSRKQRVKIENRSSDYIETDYGVPQGSVLGPTLFLIYINSLCSLNLANAKVFTFADDTAIVFHGSSWDEVESTTQLGLQSVSRWLQYNLLTLNAGKTKYVAFAISKRTLPKTPLKLTLHQIPGADCARSCDCPSVGGVNNIKYLGVLIDNHLTWKDQIAALCRRLRKLLHIFKKLRAFADDETIRLTYLALCQSVLSYCVAAWGSACKINLLPLERAQRAVLKVAYKKPFRYPTETLYQELKHLSVRQIFILTTLLKFHKNAPMVKSETHGRRRTVWKTPKVHTSFGKRSYSYLGPFIYTKTNKQLTLLTLTKRTCRKIAIAWLITQNYNDTEKLLITPT